jgi:hypothetical protein
LKTNKSGLFSTGERKAKWKGIIFLKGNQFDASKLFEVETNLKAWRS